MSRYSKPHHTPFPSLPSLTPTMASPTLLPVTGDFAEVSSCAREVLPKDRHMMDFQVRSFGSNKACCHKRRRLMAESNFSLCEFSRDFRSSLPVLSLLDYYMEPCLKDLAAQEVLDPGYISRVPDFLVGRSGYGYVRFLGDTDVRGLDLDHIVKFNRHELAVYEGEGLKPEVGQGLNKAAEVTLILQKRMSGLKEGHLDNIVKKLKASMERQGARFISFDPSNGEWKFSVDHFSRFGLSEDEDIMMDDATPVQDPVEMNGGEVSDVDEDAYMDPVEPELSHSLPAHPGLDPVKMKEMRMLMFQDEEEIDDFNGITLRHKSSLGKEHVRSHLHNSAQKLNRRSSPPVVRKTPLALLEYHPQTSDSENYGILMAQQNKDMPLKRLKADGFQLDLNHETPVTGSLSRNIVDAGLFMGRSFRVGWGPNGVLVHGGAEENKEEDEEEEEE